MITAENFSSFTQAAHCALQLGENKSIRLNDFRQKVAHVFGAKGRNDVLNFLNKRGGIPLNSRLCKDIAVSVQEYGVLPHELSHWPLRPYAKERGAKNVTLTPHERRTVWRESIERLQITGTVDGAWLEKYSNREPYIKPAGEGNWFVTGGSQVPLSVCEIVLAPSKVMARYSDQSIRIESRDDSSMAFYEGLRELWERNYAKAYDRFEAAGDHPQALFNRAWLHEDGLGCTRDQAAAAELYLRAADAGAVVAHHNLACMYLQGNDAVAANIPLALDHLEKAAAHNVAASIGKLGSLLWHGHKVEKDETRGRELLLRAARLGDGPSLNTLGTILARDNNGVPTAESIELYRHAALLAPETGDYNGDYNLGLAYLEGNGVAQDLMEARTRFCVAAEAGHADAQHVLAYMLATGRTGVTDYATAISWANKAASQQHPQALGLLGCLYFEGQGVPEDKACAAKYFRAAHQLGNLAATVFLAKMHMAGEGGEQNNEISLSLLSYAASMGHAEAQDMLDSFKVEV